MGNRLNVHCVKTPSEEGGTIPALEKAMAFEEPPDSDEGRWSSAGPVSSAVSFIVCCGGLWLPWEQTLTHLRKALLRRWRTFGKRTENPMEALPLV